MADFCNDYLGIGAAGYACIDGVCFPLNPSSITEDPGLLKSEGAVSTSISSAVGQTPAINARVLKFSLSSDLSPVTAAFVDYLTTTWRNTGSLGRVHNVNVVVASGEGWRATEAYCDSVSLNSPQGGLGSTTFSFTSYYYSPTTGTPWPKFQQAVAIFNQAAFQPIPNWATTVDFSAQSGTPIEFSLDYQNNYFYGQLLESSNSPPVPRVITAGPLDVKFKYKTLAKPGECPSESGSPTIYIGGIKCGMQLPPQTVIQLPLVYLNPSETLTGLGDQKGVIYWDCTWELLENLPTYS